VIDRRRSDRPLGIRFETLRGDDCRQEAAMKITRTMITAALIALGFASGIAAQQFPMMDKVASHVIQKYQNATCDQLWQQKDQPKSPEQEKIVGMLRSDPQMRAAFIDKIAAPVANKMFDCGMIP